MTICSTKKAETRGRKEGRRPLSLSAPSRTRWSTIEIADFGANASLYLTLSALCARWCRPNAFLQLFTPRSPPRGSRTLQSFHVRCNDYCPRSINELIAWVTPKRESRFLGAKRLIFWARGRKIATAERCSGRGQAMMFFSERDCWWFVLLVC